MYVVDFFMFLLAQIIKSTCIFLLLHRL